MLKRHVTSILIVLTPVWTVFGQGQEKTHYKLRFIKGQSYDIWLVSDMGGSGSREEDAPGVSSQISIGLGYRFDVNSVDSQGNAQVDCTLNSVKYKQKVQGGIPANQDVDYDSSDMNKQTIPEEKGLGELAFVTAKVFRALLDERFTLKMAPSGQVQQIGGLKTLRENMGKKAAKRSAAGEANMAEQSMVDMNDVQFTQLFKYYFFRPMAIYPDRPVTIGDSWTRKQEIQPRVEQQTVCILKSQKSGVATIEIDKTSGFNIQMEEPGPAFSWYFFGQADIDESTGQILRSKTTEITEMPSEGQEGRTVVTFEMKKRKRPPDK